MLPIWSHRKFMRKPNMLRSYCREGPRQLARFIRSSSANTADRSRLCPVLTGSRVVSGAPRSCQNAHDITHIINNYRLFTDGRADGHTATEICLISARLFPLHISLCRLLLPPWRKKLMKKTKCLWKKNENPAGALVAFSPFERKKRPFSLRFVRVVCAEHSFMSLCTVNIPKERHVLDPHLTLGWLQAGSVIQNSLREKE